MINLTRDIQSLTDFKRNTNHFAKQMKDTGEPVVLTVNGRAEFVIQDAESYQALVERAEQSEVIAGIRRGLEQMKRGEGRPAEDVFADLESKFSSELG